MNLPINTLLQGGKYKIVRFIGSGGFGCTYEAEHVVLEQRVAIKEFFVKDFCNRDETTAHVTVGTVSKCALVDKLRRKFIDEAKALFRLRHRGIVRVTDVFEENGTAYYVMDYVDGLSLSEIVKREGALPEERAVRYIRQVAAALQYVHDNNRLHLDIKPANIMVDQEDNAVLIDFGTSKQYDEQDGENTSTLMGKTLGYAPLEQMGNNVVKFLPATDIYALGATLYKLLTGITPPEANLLAVGETLDPLPAAVSASTRRAISAAMQINKNKRPQTTTDFLSLLNASYDRGDETTILADDPQPVVVVPPAAQRNQASQRSQVTQRSHAAQAGTSYAERTVVAPTAARANAAMRQSGYVPPKTFWGCWKSAWRNKFNFGGRASRREFWCTFIPLIVLGLMILLAAVATYDKMFYDYSYGHNYGWDSAEALHEQYLHMFVPINLTLFLFVLSTASLEFRRLRDAGRSMWWAVCFNVLPVVFLNMIIWGDVYERNMLYLGICLFCGWALLAWTMIVFLLQKSVFEVSSPKIKK